MNKKIILPINLMLLVGFVAFVSALSAIGESREIWVTEHGAPIYKGWNLVYGFMNPNQLQGQGFEAKHIKAIYGFLPGTQEYVRFYPNFDESKINQWLENQNAGDVDYLTPDHQLRNTAFWVYSDATVPGELNGMAHFTEYWLSETPIDYNERQIYKGWNFVGITKDMIPGPQDTNLKDIKGNCNIEKSYFYDADRQKWEEAPIEYAQLEERSLGSGWVIKVSDNCKLGESISSLQVPQLPQ